VGVRGSEQTACCEPSPCRECTIHFGAAFSLYSSPLVAFRFLCSRWRRHSRGRRLAVLCVVFHTVAPRRFPGAAHLAIGRHRLSHRQRPLSARSHCSSPLLLQPCKRALGPAAAKRRPTGVADGEVDCRVLYCCRLLYELLHSVCRTPQGSRASRPFSRRCLLACCCRCPLCSFCPRHLARPF